MTLRDMIDDDAVDVFLNTDEFAESVTYYPRTRTATASSSRSIAAVVFRNQMEVVSENGVSVLPVWEVHVANNSTTGIASTEIDTGGDQIGFPPRDGEDAVKKTIVMILVQDHGMLVLQCR